LNRRTGSLLAGICGALALAACAGDAGAGTGLRGSVQIDGSSTVFPITEAVAEEYMAATGGSVRVTVAMSGTGGGFRRFCNGETDVTNASRAILAAEQEACAANGVRFVSLPVASDGMAIIVHPSNDFVQCMTVDELRRIWEPSSTIQRWSQVRAEWPDRPLRLYGPGTNSGTFDYFTEEITGQVGASRSDYTASEDDNVLVQGVGGDINSLGYFGYAYWIENQTRLGIVAVDGGHGCVTPTPETIEGEGYEPLSRPLFIYVNQESLARPEVQSFVDFYLESAPELAGEVGYVPLSTVRYAESRQELTRVTNAR
jgi:phosphate transport system substrate-binding protein